MKVLGLAFSHYDRDTGDLDDVGPSMYFIIELEAEYDEGLGGWYWTAASGPLTEARPRDFTLGTDGMCLSLERGLRFSEKYMAGRHIDLSDLELLSLCAGDFGKEVP